MLLIEAFVVVTAQSQPLKKHHRDPHFEVHFIENSNMGKENVGANL